MSAPWRCTRCILSSRFPGIEFDEAGLCSFCRDEMIVTTEARAIEQAKARVAELFKTRTKPYDAVLCNSGGKDSSYTLKLAVEKYGLKVLSFTLDNGFLSNLAIRNVETVVDALGVDHITLRPSAQFFRNVIRAAATSSIYQEQSLRRISACCNACISLVSTSALRLALEKGIPTILTGFTLGQIPANGIVFRNHFPFFQEGRKDSLERLRAAVGPAIDDYYVIRESVLARVASYPFHANLLCLEEVLEDQILAEVSSLGWRQPKDVDGCSSNCQLNSFNNYIHERRYGFSPYELELSHLVRKGLIARESAIEKIANQNLSSVPSLAQRLGFTLEERVRLGLPEESAAREG